MLADLARTWGAVAPSEVPSSVRRVAGQCILDWVGCATAGATEPAVAILLAALEPPGGASSLVGGGAARPRDAALINGTAGHALDFDDTSTAMFGHPTAPVLPAVLALSEHLDATGAELLHAFITGVEIETRLGAAIGGAHYAKGWHATATIGVMGAATACERLLDLDVDLFAQALGIAASQSAGLKANFGTMTKPLHAGSAAERGLTSALLAAEGFSSNADAFAATQGSQLRGWRNEHAA
jgi:2-methylcitrate dehydratase PrpD